MCVCVYLSIQKERVRVREGFPSLLKIGKSGYKKINVVFSGSIDLNAVQSVLSPDATDESKEKRGKMKKEKVEWLMVIMRHAFCSLKYKAATRLCCGHE